MHFIENFMIGLYGRKKKNVVVDNPHNEKRNFLTGNYRSITVLVYSITKKRKFIFILISMIYIFLIYIPIYYFCNCLETNCIFDNQQQLYKYNINY